MCPSNKTNFVSSYACSSSLCSKPSIKHWLLYMPLAGSMTPTVELNALAMKRGEPAVYRQIDMPRQPYYPQAKLDFRGIYNQRLAIHFKFQER